jgi:hypothetical protein
MAPVTVALIFCHSQMCWLSGWWSPIHATSSPMPFTMPWETLQQPVNGHAQATCNWSQTVAVGREGLPSADLGLARLKLLGMFSYFFGGRHAAWYSVTDRRLTHLEDFKVDDATLFGLLRDGAIHPVVIDRLPLAATREVHDRIDAGSLGGKMVLLPWSAS